METLDYSTGKLLEEIIARLDHIIEQTCPIEKKNDTSKSIQQ